MAIYEQHQVGTMESMHVGRPVVSEGWHDIFAGRAADILGESRFTLLDPEELAIKLIGSGEILHMRKISPALQAIPVADIIEEAEKSVPQSFHSDLTITAGGLVTRTFTERSGELQNILALRTKCSTFVPERKSTTDTMDRLSGINHGWRPPRTLIKLAVIDGDVSQSELDRVRRGLPNLLTAKRGYFDTVTLTPIKHP